MNIPNTEALSYPKSKVDSLYFVIFVMTFKKKEICSTTKRPTLADIFDHIFKDIVTIHQKDVYIFAIIGDLLFCRSKSDQCVKCEI